MAQKATARRAPDGKRIRTQLTIRTDLIRLAKKIAGLEGTYLFAVVEEELEKPLQERLKRALAKS